MLHDMLRLSIVATIAIAMVGCERGKNVYYGISVENKTNVDLEPIYVIAGTNRTIPFSLDTDLRRGSSDGLFYGESPDTCTVVWTVKGETGEHRVNVGLTGIVPQDFIGTIYFIINDDFSVSVKFGDDRVEAPARGPYGHFFEGEENGENKGSGVE